MTWVAGPILLTLVPGFPAQPQLLHWLSYLDLHSSHTEVPTLWHWTQTDYDPESSGLPPLTLLNQTVKDRGMKRFWEHGALSSFLTQRLLAFPKSQSILVWGQLSVLGSSALLEVLQSAERVGDVLSLSGTSTEFRTRIRKLRDWRELVLSDLRISGRRM